ncbi:ADP-ribosylation family protein [Streptomyces sp. NPDC006733]|uniref:ADP-ribosylation family protein n=1 Tax=Streptomyces sp. NPDC006733 TaxID=3155460 RepID=UPI00340082D8
MRASAGRGPDDRARVVERFQRDWGLELPDSVLRFWEFCAAAGPAERQALADISVGPAGILDLFAEDPQPRAGIDVRVHGRFYRDPPEFLTFMYGHSDGLHYGLWTDDGRTCDAVASYYTRDGGGIDRRVETPLQTVRAILERCWTDVADDDQDDPDVAAKLVRLGLLRQALDGYETERRPEIGSAYSYRYDFVRRPLDANRLTTLDEAGALVCGAAAVGGPAPDAARFAANPCEALEDPAALERSAAEARRRCAAGDPAQALVLGRDLHWASGGDRAREGLAAQLLNAAYLELDRPSLAAIAAAHHRHRHLRDVEVLRRGTA